MMGPVQQLTKKMKLQYNNVNKTIITISLTCPPHLNTIRIVVLLVPYSAAVC